MNNTCEYTTKQLGRERRGGGEGEGWRRGGVGRDEGMHTKKTISPNGC